MPIFTEHMEKCLKFAAALVPTLICWKVPNNEIDEHVTILECLGTVGIFGFPSFSHRKKPWGSWSQKSSLLLGLIMKSIPDVGQLFFWHKILNEHIDLLVLLLNEFLFYLCTEPLGIFESCKLPVEKKKAEFLRFWVRETQLLQLALGNSCCLPLNRFSSWWPSSPLAETISRGSSGNRISTSHDTDQQKPPGGKLLTTPWRGGNTGLAWLIAMFHGVPLAARGFRSGSAAASLSRHAWTSSCAQCLVFLVALHGLRLQARFFPPYSWPWHSIQHVGVS